MLELVDMLMEYMNNMKFIKKLLLRLFGIVLVQVVNIKDGDTLIFMVTEDCPVDDMFSLQHDLGKVFKGNTIIIRGFYLDKVVRK